jgi:hypothetical protein
MIGSTLKCGFCNIDEDDVAHDHKRTCKTLSDAKDCIHYFDPPKKDKKDDGHNVT